jgi:hypothetical protein
MRGGLDKIELHGIELHRDSARQAEASVRAAGYQARVIAGDFFLVPPVGRYDAVIGNLLCPVSGLRRGGPGPQPRGSTSGRRATDSACFLVGCVHGARRAVPEAGWPARAGASGGAAVRELRRRGAQVSSCSGSRGSAWCCSLNVSFRACRKKSFCCSPTVMARDRPTTASSSSSVPLRTWRERRR